LTNDSCQTPRFRSRNSAGLLFLIFLLIILIVSFPVHASGPLGENYTLTQSATRVQETNNPGVTFVLNVTKATTLLNYQFTWSVRDPAGSTHNVNTQVNTVPSSFTTSVNYPSSFGTSTITYVGTYNLTVTQTNPPSGTVAATALFKVGLTDSLNYQRSQPVSLLAQGYGNAENVSITIAKSPSPPILATSRLANSTGQVVFTWPSIPVSAPLGNYTVAISGKTVKAISDVQWFIINPANMTIPQLSISSTSLERTQTEFFHFTTSYPNGSASKTGSATIRIIEQDGTTIHDITAVYKSATGQFQASYEIPLNGTSGVWVASIDIGAYNDGDGNLGPAQSVARGFAVSPATLIVKTTTSNNSYTTNGVVGIYASIVTPGNENFTSGTITAGAVFSGRQVESPIQLSYDQSRGEWVGSFTIKSSDPSGIWIIQVNATDAFANSGYGSTSILVTVPGPPPQAPTSTFNYLLVIIGLGAALAILGSWVMYRRGRVSHKVLKVDLEAVHSEAAKIQNDAFFQTIQEQLRDQRTSSGKSDTKSSDK
jgi:hypothetical protein